MERLDLIAFLLYDLLVDFGELRGHRVLFRDAAGAIYYSMFLVQEDF